MVEKCKSFAYTVLAREFIVRAVTLKRIEKGYPWCVTKKGNVICEHNSKPMLRAYVRSKLIKKNATLTCKKLITCSVFRLL